VLERSANGAVLTPMGGPGLAGALAGAT
jgi:hypothetical protein